MVVSPFAIGVDIGGSHITSAAVNIQKKEILYASRSRMRVNAAGEAEDILHIWASSIRYSMEFIKAETLRGIGIAIPGPFDYPKGICQIQNQHKYDSLFGLNIREELARRLDLDHQLVHFENDAACFLLGEILHGSTKQVSKAIGLTLGTGFGSAFYEQGKLKEGTLYREPFRDGIAEDYFSTRWFVNRYKALSGRSMRDVKELVQQIKLDRTAEMVFEEFGTNLAEFMVPFLVQYQPELLIIGGNIVQTWDLFIEPLQQGLAQKKLPVEIARSLMGENAHILGAACALGDPNQWMDKV